MTTPPAAAALPDPSAPAQPTSRAGRDLKAAIGVGVVLGVIIISTLLVKKESFLVVVAIAVAIGMWELHVALRNVAVRAPLVPAVLGMAGMTWAAYVHGPAGLVTAWVLTGAAVLLWRGGGRLDGAGRDVLGGIFIATYPPLLVGFAVLLLAEPDGVGRMFVFLLTAVSSDIGGYAAGVWLGKHPIAPTISPKKSWEGFAGSVVLCIVAGSLTIHFFLGHPWWIGIALGVAVAIAATIGDLMESLIKRDLGIKDMSSILPGHGGIMDRLDSLIVVVPIVWAVLSLLAERAVS
ncbi:phosphatidate cytidylyltransferase [Intrasporangium calvum]|uniref:Phosphatidate cytidylyltransferase n=1 Tax=Intrasporangium calvum (strain ATCC 23552 / DSM 43043 / JCM 3097 / NBRC 12989 / NCIMB 10167 / NRRL B-3866 / 7 KIP) TaxID=710696 RepID=E6SEY5_INTC7|nr:phosphatidate cytidylyltransferase [Intrasporangium calvum]ADU48774.1 phosphatidate cytidylyltransferase [Intrasporangium calvum DSM 43043]AXG13764.1 phosphatidate cytidylyltransferase [Intrasporangium calvum]